MSTRVIDASVVMCVLLNERGLDEAMRVSEGAFISSVNVAEIVAKCLEKNISDQLALLFLQDSDVSVINLDIESATIVGRLWKKAPKGVLSLGDRACIATAITLGGAAVTADRIWTTLDLGCKVELIR